MNETNIERLAAAAALIETAVSLFDTSETECDSCHVKRKKNWTQAQAAKELAAMALKIKRWAATLRKEQA